MDQFLVLNGAVSHVWRGGHGVPADADTRQAPAGTVVAGMAVGADGSLLQTSAAPTEAAVKDECRRRILALYPAHRQMTLLREGGSAADQMGYEIDALRACSRALSVMAPIPADFRDDRWWKARPRVASQPSAAAPTAAQPTVVVVQSPPAAPATASHHVTIYGAPSQQAPNVENPSTAQPVPINRIGLDHTSSAIPGVLGQPLPAPAAVTAPQGAGGTSPVRPVFDARDAAQAVLEAATAATKALWSEADEVRAEAATRSIRGSDASLNMLRDGAAAAGLSLDDYRADILVRRAAAHHEILAIDGAKSRALDALGSGANVDAVLAEFAADVRGGAS